MTQPFSVALRSILTVFWIGGLWVVCVLVAPILFRDMENRTALLLTNQMLRGMAWVGIVAGVYVAIHILWQEGLKALQTLEFWLIFLMLALTLVNSFVIFPILADVKSQMHAVAEGAFGGGFQSWQTISSLIYLIQSLLGIAYVVRGNAK